jgi:hypothetical protein
MRKEAIIITVVQNVKQFWTIKVEYFVHGFGGSKRKKIINDQHGNPGNVQPNRKEGQVNTMTINNGKGYGKKKII